MKRNETNSAGGESKIQRAAVVLGKVRNADKKEGKMAFDSKDSEALGREGEDVNGRVHY